MGGGSVTESIITALITGGLTLMGVLAANNKQQAITDTKLDELDPGGSGAQRFRAPGSGGGGADQGHEPPDL